MICALSSVRIGKLVKRAEREPNQCVNQNQTFDDFFLSICVVSTCRVIQNRTHECASCVLSLLMLSAQCSPHLISSRYDEIIMICPCPSIMRSLQLNPEKGHTDRPSALWACRFSYNNIHWLLTFIWMCLSTDADNKYLMCGPHSNDLSIMTDSTL